MDPDLALVVGIVVSVLSVPPLISALSERRPPRVGAVALLLGIGLIGYAMATVQGGYTLTGIPRVFARVVNLYIF
ncbi:hypothetical protein [uncultured Roseobacter sp.]|uniref:hypothetical protein n=1 Tax=uncultured Roseobacter sp. TaxID=114847 RepID=UPI0026299931|nr:hypothetical protein [uncultured Roseobacter sp.]